MSTEAVVDLVDILNAAAQPVYDAGKIAGEREAELRVTHELIRTHAAGCYDLAAAMIASADAGFQAEADGDAGGIPARRLLDFAKALLGRTPDGTYAGQIIAILGGRYGIEPPSTPTSLIRARDLCRERCDYFGGYHR